ncbi:hypothetical protein [Nocardia brasiliensis]|uniref:hypothetical protein n=1 Tax=Nocardia brasiliensis TaxID=37326 RepID=UPI003670230D
MGATPIETGAPNAAAPGVGEPAPGASQTVTSTLRAEAQLDAHETTTRSVTMPRHNGRHQARRGPGLPAPLTVDALREQLEQQPNLVDPPTIPLPRAERLASPAVDGGRPQHELDYALRIGGGW